MFFAGSLFPLDSAFACCIVRSSGSSNVFIFQGTYLFYGLIILPYS
nr:MAG TPA: hypothetical protein [Caudoviricetes sp.]